MDKKNDIVVYSWEEPHGWNGGGIVTKEEIAQPIRGSHKNKIIIIYGKEEDDNTTENRRDVPSVINHKTQKQTEDP